jgi:hypothetical protein
LTSYLPTSRILPRLYDAREPRGVIVVDDVKRGSSWDGAFEAYREFWADHNLPEERLGTKGGVLSKPG